MSIHIIDNLETTNQGPESPYDMGFQEIFLNQGSIDGACGPYSLLMGLLTLGLIDRNEVVNFVYDARTKLGKLMNDLNKNYHSLFKNGTDLDDLENIISRSFGNDVNIETETGKNKEVINFVVKQLNNNNPVIIGVNGIDCAHWMLAVGYEKSNVTDQKRLLLLDPSGEKPVVSSWNSIVNLDVNQKGKYPYYWWTEEIYIQFDQALSIYKK